MDYSIEVINSRIVRINGQDRDRAHLAYEHSADGVRITYKSLPLIPAAKTDVPVAYGAIYDGDPSGLTFFASDNALLTVLRANFYCCGGEATDMTDTNTHLENANDAIGAKADAAAGTDAGNFSLISLFKRLLGKLPGSLSQKTKADSFAVTLASDEDLTQQVVTLTSAVQLSANNATFTDFGPSATMAALAVLFQNWATANPTKKIMHVNTVYDFATNRYLGIITHKP